MHTVTRIQREEEMSEDCEKSTIVRINKRKGDPQDWKGYRGISLQCNQRKVFTENVTRQNETVCCIRRRTRRVCTRNRSTTDQLFTMRHIFEKTLNTSHKCSSTSHTSTKHTTAYEMMESGEPSNIKNTIEFNQTCRRDTCKSKITAGAIKIDKNHTKSFHTKQDITISV